MRATKGACNRGNLQVAITLPWGTFGCGCMFVLLEGIFYRFCKVVCNVVTLSVRALTYRIGFSHPPPPRRPPSPAFFYSLSNWLWLFLAGASYSCNASTRSRESTSVMSQRHASQ